MLMKLKFHNFQTYVSNVFARLLLVTCLMQPTAIGQPSSSAIFEAKAKQTTAERHTTLNDDETRHYYSQKTYLPSLVLIATHSPEDILDNSKSHFF